MRLVVFCHSLVSDWNHGNAHFLRGLVRELLERGHGIQVLEPAGGWSRQQLEAEHPEAVELFATTFPELSSTLYDAATLDLDLVLEEADAVLVHEWSPPELVAALGRRRAAGGRFQLLFHDTHHRAVSRPEEMEALELDGYDAVLAFGEVLAEVYRRRGWSRRAFTWHEAADTRLFRPHPEIERQRRLAWIGNWGDEERTAELHEFLLDPVRRLGLPADVWGVRYPDAAQKALTQAGVAYHGWTPNARVPDLFAAAAATVHVPRRQYVHDLPGVPTIRIFEALACGVPLVCAPWRDCEGLFRPGHDYLQVREGEEMEKALRQLLDDPALAAELADHGLETIRSRHTCAHRADELEAILAVLQGRAAEQEVA